MTVLHNTFDAVIAFLVDDEYGFPGLFTQPGLFEKQQGAGVFSLQNQVGGVAVRQVAVGGVHQGEVSVG